jgi:hypothetical protein
MVIVNMMYMWGYVYVGVLCRWPVDPVGWPKVIIGRSEGVATAIGKKCTQLGSELPSSKGFPCCQGEAAYAPSSHVGGQIGETLVQFGVR